MKTCTKCDQLKSLSEFYTRKTSKDGFANWCKSCVSVYQRNRYENQPGVKEQHLTKCRVKRLTDPTYVKKAKDRSNSFYVSMNGRARTLLKGARTRNAQSTVTFDHIMRMLEHGVCPVTGFNFDITSDYRARTGIHNNPYAPSLDQFVAGGGYTDENTRLVIWQYNMMKGQLTDSETLIICQAVVRNANET